MRNLLKKIFPILILSVFFNSCSDYLEVDLAGNQLTIEETFSKKRTAERYLAHVYSYLNVGVDFLGQIDSEGEYTVTSHSDEMIPSYEYGFWNSFRQGSWGISNTNYHLWVKRYQAIQQATIFMNHIFNVEDLDNDEKIEMFAEARFLRAYYYMSLVKQYGPVFIWGDKMADAFIDSETVDRHTLEQNLEFIFSEFDLAISDLPEVRTTSSEYGRVSKAAAMSAKAELAILAARPLYNGCDLYKGEMKNLDGEYLFPQTPDPEKWEIAAKAAKDVIDLNVFSLYEYTEDDDPFRNKIKSTSEVFFDKWNKELIWGRWLVSSDYGNYLYKTSPKAPRPNTGGSSGYGASLKLVDTYPMRESGRYPVLGYNGLEPIIDPKSGYVSTGFTDNWTHPLDTFATFKAHNSIIGRDARFYSSVLANGMYWIETKQGEIPITFFRGGTATYSSTNECLKSGYLLRRFTDPAVDYGKRAWGNFVFPFYRLAEIYLNYAEACNEKPNRNESEALLYFNKIRARAGLNNIEEAYPEVIGNKALLRELLRKERFIELALEGKRYHDVRTWMIGEEEFNMDAHTLNLAKTNYEDSWERVDDLFPNGRMSFETKHYLFPMNEDRLIETKNITQNYGW